MRCEYTFGKRNGLVNLGITCFFIIPFQIHSYYQMNKKVNAIEKMLIKLTDK